MIHNNVFKEIIHVVCMYALYIGNPRPQFQNSKPEKVELDDVFEPRTVTQLVRINSKNIGL